MREQPSRICFRQAGFNLVEMIVVIAVTGILSAIVAVFIKGPVSGYIDTTRRAELTDIADTALRRIGRDLHLALPNSVRVTAAGGSQFLEFLQTSTGGRYRADGPGDILDFTSATDNSFDVLGLPVTLAPGDQVVVYNLGIPGADAYAGDNRRAYSGSGGAASNVGYTSTGAPFPFESPAGRFHVVDTPVTYECTAAGRLIRYWGYAIQAGQPTAFSAGTRSALLAGSANATVSCSFVYTSGVTNRSGIVEILLQVVNTANSERASLYYEAHVNNVP